MAVIEVKRQRKLKGRFGTDYRNEYTVEFHVVCDSQMEPFSVYSAALAGTPDHLPSPFDYYDYDGVLDTSSYCLDVSVEMIDEHAGRWKAVATYGRLPPNTTPNDQPTNPLDKPNRERLEWIEAAEVIEKDRLGNPIANTVGDPFHALPEEPVLYPVLVIEKVYATIDEIINLGLQYHGTVNSATFRNGPPRTVKFLPVQSSDIQYTGTVSYYVAELRFAYNEKTWDKEFLNRGWRVRPAAGQDPIAAIDPGTHLPVTTPVKLAADGTLLGEGLSPHYVKYEVHELLDYNAIGGI